MKKHKTLRRTIALFVGLSFFISSLFCCCLTTKAQAQSVKIEKKVPSCHKASNTTQSSESTKHQSCDCDSMKQADKIIQSFAPALALNSWGKLQALVQSLDYPTHSSLLQGNTGPPVARSSIPVYLQISNLRL